MQTLNTKSGNLRNISGMKGRLCVAGLGLALVALTACGGRAGAAGPIGGGGGGEGAVRSRIEQEFKALRAKDWRGIYDASAPSAQASCSYDEFRQHMNSGLGGVDTRKFDFDQLEISVDGDAASATYVMKYSGHTAPGAPVEDKDMTTEFQRIDGHWYEAGDGDLCNL